QLGSCRHRDWVSAISRLALERTWLTRVLLRRVSTGFCLDDYLRSSSSFLPATTFLRIATFSRECIDMFLFDSCRSSHKLDFHEPSGTENEYCRARNECTGMIQRNHGLKVKPGSPLLAAPSIVNLVALMTGIVRFSMAWGEDLAWAASTCRAMALPDSAGNVGIIGVLVELLDALMTMLTVDNKCDRATAEEVRSHRRAATAAMPTGTRALAQNIYGGVAELEELTCQLLHSMQAVLRRSAILLSTSRTGTCDALTTVVPEKERVPIAVVQETVSQVLRAVSPLFEPGGCVSALLDSQILPEAFTDESCSHGSSPFWQDKKTSRCTTKEKTDIAPVVLVGTLHLATIFFSLCSECRYDCGFLRLEGFASRLFLGFSTYLGNRAGSVDPESKHINPKVMKYFRWECRLGLFSLKMEEEHKDTGLMCSLYLDALGRLVAIPDPAVREAMHELHVERTLLTKVLRPPTAITNSTQTAAAPAPAMACGEELTSTSTFMCAKGGTEEQRCTTSGVPAAVSSITLPTCNDNTTMAIEGGAVCTSDGKEMIICAPGDRIDGLFAVRPGGRPRWFPGRVVEVHQDGTVDVCYDDGDEERYKDPEKVRPQRKRAQAIRQGAVAIGARGAKGETTSAEMPGSGGVEDALVGGYSAMNERVSGSATFAGQSSEHNSRGCVPFSKVVDNHRRTIHGCDTSERIRGLSWSHNCGGLTTVSTDSSLNQNGSGYTAGDGSSGGSSDDGGDGNDSNEEECKYFVIQSVLIDSEPAGVHSQPRVRPTSTIPRIDLDSPFLRTSAIRSSQLGPGSSLSTPTTGGGCGIFWGSAGSRMEAVSSTAAANGVMLPPRQSPSFLVDCSSARSPLDISRHQWSGIGGAGAGGARAASTLLSSPRSNSGINDRRKSTRMTDLRKNDPGVPAVTSGTRGGQGGSENPQGATTPLLKDKQNEVQRATTRKRASGVAAALFAESSSSGTNSPLQSTNDELPSSIFALRNGVDMQESAVTLLLHLMSTISEGLTRGAPGGEMPGTRVYPTFSAMTEPGAIFDLEIDGIYSLQRLFDDPQNAHLIPGVMTRWRPTTTEKSAILAKLSCVSLFDGDSYNLNGRHIEGGTFGDVLVSRSPLRIQAPTTSATPTITTSKRSCPTIERVAPQKNQTIEGIDDDISEVALKVVERDPLDHSIGSSVYREILALRALSGVVGICKLHDFGLTPTSYVLVMDKCVCSLKRWMLGRRGARSTTDGSIVRDDTMVTIDAPSSDEEVILHLSIFRQIASAAAGMASRGVTHFDLKCDNVLVRDTGYSYAIPEREVGEKRDHLSPLRALPHDIMNRMRVPVVCVADFGEAVVGRLKSCLVSTCQRRPCNDNSHRQFEFDVQRPRGTERVQSPEMLLWAGGRGSSSSTDDSSRGVGGAADDRWRRRQTRFQRRLGATINTAADVWSLGCLLYEILSGRFLFGSYLWSEFFVTLTAGEYFETGDKLRESKKSRKSQPEMALPPPSQLEPFAGLDSAETLRKLMGFMLVRDPSRRPSASSVVVETEKALVTVIDALPLSRTLARLSTSSGTTKIAVETMVEKGKIGLVKVDQQRNDSLRDSGIGTTFEWPIQPCRAVGIYREVAVEQSTLLGCKGYVSRLATGAFLLTLIAREKWGREVGCRDEHGSKSRNVEECTYRDLHLIGPKTLVCTVGNMLAWRCEGIEHEVVTLEDLLPTVGITHVVCVMTESEDRGLRERADEGCGGGQQNGPPPARRRRTTELRKTAEGSNIRDETAVVRGIERDVQAFATGSRVLFVGLEGHNGGAAGAVAMAWAMGRTGKGILETMFNFRQSCCGFWVEPSRLRAFSGL
ncbi:unnamed protein product, partial [Sphacelaria rigidula]